MQTLTLRTLSPMRCTEPSIHTLSIHYNPKGLLFARHLRLRNFLEANFLPILKIAPTNLPSIYCETFVNHQYILMPVMLHVFAKINEATNERDTQRTAFDTVERECTTFNWYVNAPWTLPFFPIYAQWKVLYLLLNFCPTSAYLRDCGQDDRQACILVLQTIAA